MLCEDFDLLQVQNVLYNILQYCEEEDIMKPFVLNNCFVIKSCLVHPVKEDMVPFHVKSKIVAVKKVSLFNNTILPCIIFLVIE